MISTLAFVVAFLLAIPVGVPAQQLTEADIVEAIKMGEDDDFDDLISDCTAGPNFRASFGGFGKGFDIVTMGSAGRIAMAAREGKRKYMPVNLESVADDLRSQQLHVMAEPNDPDADDRAPMIEHLVLKAKEKPKIVLQSESVETEIVEWINFLGGKLASNRVVAIFSLDGAKNLTPGDVDVAVITTAGEFRCKIEKKDRERLFPPNR